jgi:hypothetical protein
MSSSERLDLVLRKTSNALREDFDNVQKCETFEQQVRKFYLEDIEPFLKVHDTLLRPLKPESHTPESSELVKEISRGARFYNTKAKEYFGFFGVDFVNPLDSKEVEIPDINRTQLLHFLYSSVELLYITLWEVSVAFLKPLERLYYLRLCESGVLPETYPIFFGDREGGAMQLSFLSDVLGARPLFRVSESFPYELLLLYRASDYFRSCFSLAAQELGNMKSEDLVDDFMRLFIIRNNICHIGKGIILQEESEEKTQNLLYRLTTHLPRIQKSCAGIVLLFKALANKEADKKGSE